MYFCYHDAVWNSLGCSDIHERRFIDPVTPEKFVKPIVCHPAVLEPLKGTFMKRCIKQYLPPCLDYDYHVRDRVETTNHSEDVARIRMAFENDFVIVLVVEPQMTAFDLFYEVASLVGLWLGWSIEEGSTVLIFYLKMIFAFFKRFCCRFRRRRQFLS